MATNPVLPSSQLASYKNQQLGGLLTGSGTGINAGAQLGALQNRSSMAQQSASGIGDSVVAGNARLAVIASQAPKPRPKPVPVAVAGVGNGGGNGGGYTGPGGAGSAENNWVDVGGGNRADPAAAAHLRALQQSAGKSGYNIGVNEAGRSRARQSELYNLYRAGRGNLAAAPGHSVHEKGTAFDLNGFGGNENSLQFKWLLANAKSFGFSWVGKTFSQREPWHWEYTG